jgi:hypothetical protein
VKGPAPLADRMTVMNNNEQEYEKKIILVASVSEKCEVEKLKPQTTTTQQQQQQ